MMKNLEICDTGNANDDYIEICLYVNNKIQWEGYIPKKIYYQSNEAILNYINSKRK